MDAGGLFTLKSSVVPHGTTNMDVVYTNDPFVLESTLEMYELRLLQDRPRFVDLDLEYTSDQSNVAVVQLAIDKHVLVYHFCRSPDKQCRALREFLLHKGICFTTVDIRGDSDRFAKDGITIPEHKWIDIQDMINFNGPDNRTGMGDLAAVIIDPSYKNMKSNFPTNSHNHWECLPLPEVNLRYAAIDGYVSFELYRRLKKINDGQRQVQQIPREVVCPDCKEAARLANLPPAWRDDNKQFVGTNYWEWVSYCNRNNIPFDPKNMPPGIKAPWEPTSGSLWDGGAHGEQARARAGCGELARVGPVSGSEAQTRIPDTRSAYEYRTWTANPWEAGTSGTGKRIKRDDDNW